MRAGAGFFNESGLNDKGLIENIKLSAGLLARHFHSSIMDFLNMSPLELFDWMPVLEAVMKKENPNG